MSNLNEQLNQIKVDLSTGKEKLLTLVNSIIKEKKNSSLIETFQYLSRYSVSPFITSDSVKVVMDYIKGVKSEKEKVELLQPILIYIYPFDNLASQYTKERDEFVELCNKLERYFELSQYYLKCEEKNPYNFDEHSPAEKLSYTLDIAEACVKAGDKEKSKTWALKAKDNFFPQSMSLDLRVRFYENRANYNILEGLFDNASRDFLILYNETKDKPEASEYFRKSAVYAILSNGPTKNGQISLLVGEEKMKSLPIYELLERMIKQNIITSKELPEFKKQLCNESGYSDSNLNLTVLNQNIRAISRFFTTISYDRISQITGENVETVLEHLQDLISTQAVNSLIDQPNKMIYFNPIITEEQRKDASISTFCRELQQFTLGISH